MKITHRHDELKQSGGSKSLSVSKLWGMVSGGEAWHAAVSLGSQTVGLDLVAEKTEFVSFHSSPVART